MIGTVPLGVRIFDFPDDFDYHLTKWVEDFTFRSTAPGGFASCTLKIHPPATTKVDPAQFGRLFYRVEIFDLRSAEIVWEGRIEEPAQEVDTGIWEVGVLGSAVVATDVQAPFLYIDTTLEQYRVTEADAWDINLDTGNKFIEIHMKPGYVYNAGTEFTTLTYNGFLACQGAVARISTTYKGSGPGSAGGSFDMLLTTTDGNIDVTAFNAAQIYKTNVAGTDIQAATFPANYIEYGIRRRSGTGNYTIGASEEGIARFKWPRNLGIRVNELGDALTTAASYPSDWVTVKDVVADVVGRLLGGSLYRQLERDYGGTAASYADQNWPERGSVRGTDAFIDRTDSNRITNLWWDEGVDAKTILETMMIVQTNAYWAIWESGHRFVNTYNNSANYAESQFRFEWASWPLSWSYIASSDDGMSLQIDGEELYNSGSMAFDAPEDFNTTQTRYANTKETLLTGVTQPWDVPELQDRFLRHQHFVYPDPVDASANWDQYPGEDYLRKRFADNETPKNAGTLTIRRPIFMSDNGDADGGGYQGMVDPWLIRPGKMIKIRDIHPMYNATNFNYDAGIRRVMNPNNSFDVNTTGWTATGQTAFAIDTTKKWAGAASGKLTPTGAAANTFIETTASIPVVGGGKYEAVAMVQNAVSRNIWFRFTWTMSDATTQTSWSGPWGVTANLWSQMQTLLDAPIGAVSMKFAILMGGSDGVPPASNILWIDEAYFNEVGKFPDGHQNCIWRIAAVEYSTSDNSAKLELDQIPKWALPAQVLRRGTTVKLSIK